MWEMYSSPFCQISTGLSSLSPQGLLNPPTYSPPLSAPLHHETTASQPDGDQPPPYTVVCTLAPSKEKEWPPAEDVLHFVNPSHDTILSLALRYGVPQDALRQRNSLFADHLLAARKTILIPGEFYKCGVSLSPKPLESEEEELRKSKIRRWMVACKVSEYVKHRFPNQSISELFMRLKLADRMSSIPTNLSYDIALLYLQQANYDLDAAVEAYLADVKWEEDHPMAELAKGKKVQRSERRRFGVGAGLTRQI
ncbi:MAG: hypothetical protein Q9217_003092 [Psora testacea]